MATPRCEHCHYSRLQSTSSAGTDCSSNNAEETDKAWKTSECDASSNISSNDTENSAFCVCTSACDSRHTSYSGRCNAQRFHLKDKKLKRRNVHSDTAKPSEKAKYFNYEESEELGTKCFGRPENRLLVNERAKCHANTPELIKSKDGDLKQGVQYIDKAGRPYKENTFDSEASYVGRRNGLLSKSNGPEKLIANNITDRKLTHKHDKEDIVQFVDEGAPFKKATKDDLETDCEYCEDSCLSKLTGSEHVSTNVKSTGKHKFCHSPAHLLQRNRNSNPHTYKLEHEKPASDFCRRDRFEQEGIDSNKGKTQRRPSEEKEGSNSSLCELKSQNYLRNIAKANACNSITGSCSNCSLRCKNNTNNIQIHEQEPREIDSELKKRHKLKWNCTGIRKRKQTKRFLVLVVLIVLNIIMFIGVTVELVLFENKRCVDCRTLNLTDIDSEVILGDDKGHCCLEHFMSLLAFLQRHHAKEISNIESQMKEVDIKIRASAANMTVSEYRELYKTIQASNNMVNDLLTKQNPAIHLTSTKIGKEPPLPIWSEELKTKDIRFVNNTYIIFEECGLYFLYCTVNFEDGSYTGVISYKFVEHEPDGNKKTHASVSISCQHGTKYCQTLTLQKLINVTTTKNRFSFDMESSQGLSLLSRRNTQHLGLFKV